MFRLKLKTALIAGALRRSEGEHKSAAGRKPWGEVLIFKVLVLQVLYNLSAEAMEYQLRDRHSFMRFVRLGLEDAVPDAKTLWLYREALAKTGAVEKLLDLFDGYLKDKGYLATGGQKLDDLLDGANNASTVWAAVAYRSQETEKKLAVRGFMSRIHRRGCYRKPISSRQEAANKMRLSVLRRVEHVFDSQHTSMGKKLVPTIGIICATTKIGMQNVAYNMRRLVVLERGLMTAAP